MVRVDPPFSSLVRGHSALDNLHSALGTRHSALGTRHLALGTRHSALGTWQSACVACWYLCLHVFSLFPDNCTRILKSRQGSCTITCLYNHRRTKLGAGSAITAAQSWQLAVQSPPHATATSS